MDDKFSDECGIVAIFLKDVADIAEQAFFGLNAIQHRGQESAGIAIINNGQISCYKNAGLVTDVFDTSILSLLKSNMCVAHVKYSTAKDRFSFNAQPYVLNYKDRFLAISFNGGIVNGDEIKKELIQNGVLFNAQSDAELIATLIAFYDNSDIVLAIKNTIKKLKGGYSFVVMTSTEIIAVRDTLAMRPLALGKTEDGYYIASESCAFDIMDVDFVRDISPGEILVINKDGLNSVQTKEPTLTKRATCIFEYVYFARPDSTIDGRNVYQTRELAGQILAMEKPAYADLVVGVPDSGTPAAIGYSIGSQIPYSAALIKNKYVGRTFIEPTQQQRETSVKIKLNPIKELVKNKRIVLVDDSIVRGTTMKKIILAFKNAGATEVHLRISSPPVNGICYFGVDTANKEDLIANSHSVEEICTLLGADSLGFISVEGLLASVGGTKNTNCISCFNKGV